MKVGIHQPNFFPWMGYFDKMESSDAFIIMDDVQLTDSSLTQRSKILNCNGVATYLTVAFEKKGYLQKKIREIKINEDIDWQKRQMDFLRGTYGKIQYWSEVEELIRPIYEKKYRFLIDVNMKTIEIIRDLLKINTPIRMQSDLSYDKDSKKDELVLALCKSIGANKYLSGNGAKKYMRIDIFTENEIQVEYQKFNQPAYKQIFSSDFQAGLSMLDVLVNCGIDKTIKLFNER